MCLYKFHGRALPGFRILDTFVTVLAGCFAVILIRIWATFPRRSRARYFIRRHGIVLVYRQSRIAIGSKCHLFNSPDPFFFQQVHDLRVFIYLLLFARHIGVDLNRGFRPRNVGNFPFLHPTVEPTSIEASGTLL